MFDEIRTLAAELKLQNSLRLAFALAPFHGSDREVGWNTLEADRRAGRNVTYITSSADFFNIVSHFPDNVSGHSRALLVFDTVKVVAWPFDLPSKLLPVGYLRFLIWVVLLQLFISASSYRRKKEKVHFLTYTQLSTPIILPKSFETCHGPAGTIPLIPWRSPVPKLLVLKSQLMWRGIMPIVTYLRRRRSVRGTVVHPNLADRLADTGEMTVLSALNVPYRVLPLMSVLATSADVFLSRLFVSLYQNGGLLVLGLLGTPESVGLFALADRVRKASLFLLTPIAYLLFEGRPLTTRGRWFNPVVFALAAFLKRLPQLKRVQAPIFIVGTGRSGTTILGIVLSMHREVGFLNEPKALWAGLHSGEDLIGSYNCNTTRYRLEADDAKPEVKQGAHRVYGAFLRLGGVQRVVDKYPEMVFRPWFLREIFPDARFLFLSRCGADTCSSIRQWSERLGTVVNSESHDWWGIEDRKWNLLVDQIVPEHPDLAIHSNKLVELDHEGRAAVEWIVTMREGLQLMSNDPHGTLHVPYEALCSDPRGWTERLETFLQLPSDPVFENYAVTTLSDPARDIKLDLPDWLSPIFNATQAQLNAAAVNPSTLEGNPG